MSTPTVSVVLPIYNGAAFLREAVDSILTQTFHDLELILVDDGSTDGSRRIAEDYAQRDARVKVLSNAQAKGVSGALNTGLEVATGVYLARMDADDISLPERLQKQVAYLEEHPEVTLCGTWVRLMGEHAGTEWKLATDWEAIRCTMLFHNAVAHPTVMWRRADFLRHGWHYAGHGLAQDYELWTRIAGTVRIVNLPDVLLLYRVHARSVTQVHAPQPQADDRAIQLRQLQLLDLVPTAEELEIHVCLSRPLLQPTQTFVQQATAWLDKILAANERSGVFPKTVFARCIARRKQDLRTALVWQRVCTLFGGTLIGKVKGGLERLIPQHRLDRLVSFAQQGLQRVWRLHQ